MYLCELMTGFLTICPEIVDTVEAPNSLLKLDCVRKQLYSGIVF